LVTSLEMYASIVESNSKPKVRDLEHFSLH